MGVLPALTLRCSLRCSCGSPSERSLCMITVHPKQHTGRSRQHLAPSHCNVMCSHVLMLSGSLALGVDVNVSILRHIHVTIALLLAFSQGLAKSRPQDCDTFYTVACTVAEGLSIADPVSLN